MKALLLILKVFLFVLVGLPLIVITALAYLSSKLGTPVGVVLLKSGKKDIWHKEIRPLIAG